MSLLCGWVWNIQSMIVFCVLQGLVGGLMIFLVFIIVFVFFQGKQWVIVVVIIGGLVFFVLMLGLMVGGWIIENYNWYWLFFINVVLGIYIVVVVLLLVKVDIVDFILLCGVDYFSILLLVVFFGCLEYIFEEGFCWGWFDDVILMIIVWVVLFCGVVFVICIFCYLQLVMDLWVLQD